MSPKLYYGNPLQVTAQVTDFGYAGMIANADSGLNLTTYRPYDPVSGRFLLRDPIGEAGDSEANLYAYVGENPVGATDESGLWQITVAAGVGFGGKFTFGNNGGTSPFNGQWNYGAYAGVGEGLSADVDVFNRGCKNPGTNYGAEAEGEAGLGPHVNVEAHAFGNEPWWNVNFGAPGTPLGASVGTEGVTVPTLSFGESAVVGVGGTVYF